MFCLQKAGPESLLAITLLRGQLAEGVTLSISLFQRQCSFPFPLNLLPLKAVKSGVCMLSQCDLPSKHKRGKQREEEATASDWKNNESILLSRPSERL